MKTLIISDIHGCADRLVEALDTPLTYDQIILVGDLMYHGPRNPILEDYNPAKVASILNDIKKPIIAVRGNCDSEVDQMLIDFPILADFTTLQIDKLRIHVTHGHLEDPSIGSKKSKAQLYISGHTHLPNIKVEGNCVLLNPGSISLPKENNPASYAYLDNNALTIYTLEHEIFKQFKI